jgi:hypothetical protein
MSFERRFIRKNEQKREPVMVCVAECDACDKGQLERRTGSAIRGTMVCDGCGASLPITKWLGKRPGSTEPDPKTPAEWSTFLAERTAEFNADRRAGRGQA